MKILWRYVLVVAALMLAAALLVGCEEEIEPFPDMTPPAAGTGGVRGHMHGDPTSAGLCSEDWEAETNPLGGLSLVIVCPASKHTATIDASENDLFFFDGLEPGDYWLIGIRSMTWYVIGGVGGHGYKVTVKEGQWTDVRSFKFEGS